MFSVAQKFLKNQIFQKLAIILISISVLSGGFLAVYQVELKKKAEKFDSLGAYYKGIYSNWDKFKSDYLNQAESLKNDNVKGMDYAKVQYEDLLARQQAIVKEHTRLVAQGDSVTSSVGTGQSNTTTQVKKVIKVSKPQSAPKTSAS